MEAAGILLEPAGTFFTRYDPHVFPDIFNSFSTAALRMGHTLIRGAFRLDVRSRRAGNYPRLEVKDFFNPTPLFQEINGQNPYELIVRGLTQDRARKIDP